METAVLAFRFKQIAGDILLVLAILLTVDVVIVMLRRINAVVLKADYRKFFHYELILCAILLVFALDVRFSLLTMSEYMAIRIVGWLLRFAVILFSAAFAIFCGKVIRGGVINTAERADYAIVLGLALENGNPVPDLYKRLDTAQAYLDKNPEARLILTGGNAEGSGRTEAAVMRDILTARGVPADRLILEDQAQTTRENFVKIASLISVDEPVVMISSDYHMDRAVRNAAEEGFTRVMRLPAPSGFWAYGANIVMEVLLEWNELLF